MLQVDRKSRPPNGNKQMTKNFLALNKSAVTARSKEVTKGLAKEKPANGRSNRVKVHGGQQEVPINNQEKQHRSQQVDDPSSNRRDDTVTISKKYLEELLRSSYMKEHGNKSSLVLTSHNGTTDESQSASNGTHVEMDHSHIPGLEDFSNKAVPPSLLTQKQPENKLKIIRTTQEEEEFIDSTYPGCDPPPLLPSLSPRAGETYHRGTYSRPVHPAMKSNIVFGNETFPTTNHLKLTSRKKLQEDLADQMSQKRMYQVSPASNDRAPQYTDYNGMVTNPLDAFRARETEMKRQKELEYKECLRLQIEEKQRRREEERLQKERDDREDEERLAREHEQLKILHEREREIRRQKEEQKAHKMKALQQRMEQVEEVYRERRHGRPPLRRQKEVPINDESAGDGHGILSQSIIIDEDGRTGGHKERNVQLMVPSSADINRSPSMHQIVSLCDGDTKSPSHHHKSPTHTHNHTKQHQPSDKPHEHLVKNPRNRLRKHAGLIPGSQISLGSTSPEELSVVPRKARAKPSSSRAGLTEPQRGGDRKGSGPKETTMQRKTAIRKQLEKNIRGGAGTDSESEVPYPSNRAAQIPNSIARSKVTRQTNNVPNRVKQHHHNQRPSSTDSQTNHLQNRQKTRRKNEPIGTVPLSPPLTAHSSHPPAPSYHPPAPSSPPVPAVAKRLALENSNRQSNDIHEKVEQYSVSSVNSGLSHDLSFKLPQITNGITRNDVIAPSDVTAPSDGMQCVPSDDTAPSNVIQRVPSDVIQRIPSDIIQRAPSCSPCQDDWTSNVCKLPPIQELGSREEKRDALNDSRQQQILKHLSQLRQGIITHSSGIDTRVSAVLSTKSKLL